MVRKQADWYHLLPPHTQGIIEVLRKNGFTVYVVGGAVRDLLLGQTPKDFDLVTNAVPDQVTPLFPKTLEIGKHFGISMIVTETPEGNHTTELATFRTDGEYNDNRHPESVQFSTPESDAKRRDFTVNGLFWDPIAKEVIDYVGGMADIEARCLRTIGRAEDRFSEDALRILRAVRFMAQLAPWNFLLDPITLAAMRKCSRLLTNVSRERITQELGFIWKSPEPSRGIALLEELGLWQCWFMSAQAPNGLSQTLTKLIEPSQKWAAVLSHTDTSKTLSNFVFPRGTRELVQFIEKFRPELQNAKSWELWRLKQFLQNPLMEDALAIFCAEQNPSANWLADKRTSFIKANTLNPPPLLQGKDLMALGIPQGPKIKELLEKVRKAQLNEEILTKEEAERLLKP